MQKSKRIFYVLATLLAILPIASCKMDGGDIKAASIEIEKEQTKGSTLIIRTNVSTQEQTAATNARSAVPSALLDTDGNPLVFAGALYAGSTQEKDKKFQKGEYTDGKLTLTFESSEEDRNGYTLEIRAYKDGTENFDDKYLLYGTETVTIGANKLEITAPPIKLKPYVEATEKGKINLEILIPSEYDLLIKVEVEGINFSPREETTDQVQVGYKKYIISEGVKAGIYEVDFQLNLNGETVYLWSEAINVYPGMTTDKWNSGSVNGDGARQINKASIFSTFYVVGENPQSKWFNSTSRSSTEENGSLSNPFTNIQKAIDKVLAINDESTPFSIYIDGTLTQSSAPTGKDMADFSALDKNLTLTIKSLSETAKATLDANKKSRVMYITPANGGKLDLTLKNLVITNGSVANENGGGIYFDDSNGALTMDGCTVKGSEATNGGGIYLNGGTLEIKGCIVGDETENDSEIKSNTATSQGGGIYITGSKEANISGTTIFGNTANVDGGGVYVTGCTLTMDGTISGNTAQQGGGVYVTGGTGVFTMTGGKISDNHTTEDSANGNENGIAGGGIFIYSGGQANISNTTISENTANNNGGGIHVNGGTLTINAGTTISKNTAEQNGGGVYVAGGMFTMSDGTIGGDTDGYKNTAKNGGGVYVNSGKFTMSGGTISRNEAIKGDDGFTEQGGGVYVNSATFEISGSATISGNKADKGGGIYVYKGSAAATLTMNGGTISGNNATQDGGGVYVDVGTFNMSNGTINGGNNAKYGGGVYIANGGKFIMNDDSEIRGNKAEGADSSGGGGVNIYNGTFEMSGGTISGNTVTSTTVDSGGGGVYVYQNSTFTMSGGTIGGNTDYDKNTAAYGGGVYNASGTFTMNGGTFSGNSANNQGNGAYINSTFNMSDNAQFNENDDIYLVNSNKINITGTLSESKVATITPYKYEAGRQVLSADNETIMQDNYSKFAVKKEADDTKWKIVPYEADKKYGVLKKDNVSPDDGSGGISVTIPGVGSYTFEVKYNGAQINDGDELPPNGDISIDVKDSSGNVLTSGDGTFSIEIRDESGITHPNASATGFQCAATVPTLPPIGMKMQIYAKVVLNSGIVIDKTISVTGPKPPEPQL